MSKIYVTNFSPANDYSEVESVGSLIFCTEGIVKHDPHQLHAFFRRAFTQATVQDYILLSGSQILTAVAYTEWARRFPTVSAFIWDKREKKFVLKHINVPQDDPAQP